MTEEQAARKIESMMREDPELAQCISEGLAEQTMNALKGWLEKNRHQPSGECPAGLGQMKIRVLRNEGSHQSEVVAKPKDTLRKALGRMEDLKFFFPEQTEHGTEWHVLDEKGLNNVNK